MNNIVGAALVAFVVGSTLPTLELVTGTYPRTFFLLRRCKSLYLYAVMYGLVASVTSVISGTLLQSGSLKLEGPWIASPYVQAFVIGVSVRAVLHINLFTLTSGKTTTPIGFETFTRFFEAGLLRDMKFFEFIQIDGYLAGYANRFTIDEAKARARANVPATLAAEERDAFVVDVEKASAVRDVMEVFLRFAGQRPFEYAYK